MFRVQTAVWNLGADPSLDDEDGRCLLRPSARFVLLALSWHVSHERVERGYEPEVWPSQRRLVAMTGLSLRTVRRALVDLTHAGVIEDTGMLKGSEVRVYRIDIGSELPPDWEDGQDDRRGSQSGPPGDHGDREPRPERPTEPVSEPAIEPGIERGAAPSAAAVDGVPLDDVEQNDRHEDAADDSLAGLKVRLAAADNEKDRNHMQAEIAERIVDGD
jgi:hypothetical protein